MTALAADRYPAPRLITAIKRRFPVAASAVIYKGGMVGLSGSGSSEAGVLLTLAYTTTSRPLCGNTRARFTQ